MKQFFTVLRFELENYYKNKSFVITTVILMLVLSAIVVVPTIIPGLLDEKEPQKETVMEEDKGEETGIVIQFDNEEFKDYLDGFKITWKQYSDENELETAIKNKDIESGFVVRSPSDFVYLVEDRTMSDQRTTIFSEILNGWNKQCFYRSLIEQGIDADEISEAESFTVKSDERVLGKNSVKNYWYTYILIFAIYFLIIFYGQMIAVSVTNEKSNRAIEILVTSVNSNSLIIGKVIAGALAGIMQMFLILGSAFLSYALTGDKWGGRLDILFDVPPKIWVAYIFFGMLSYLLYAFIFGALGALVSKTEDISKSATPVTLIYVISFFIGIFGLQFSDSLWVKIASFIPFTSGNAMFIRISMGNTEVWEILVSGLILLLSCGGAAWLAAKIFRFGTLNYGNPIRLSRALKGIKEQ